jgi:hypothetical protein
MPSEALMRRGRFAPRGMWPGRFVLAAHHTNLVRPAARYPMRALVLGLAMIPFRRTGSHIKPIRLTDSIKSIAAGGLGLCGCRRRGGSQTPWEQTALAASCTVPLIAEIASEDLADRESFPRPC